MKNKIKLLVLFSFIDCFTIYIILIFNNKVTFPFTNQFPPTPKNSKYSEENGLLVKRYSIPKDTINIFDENYIVIDAWVSHNFTNSKKEKINKNYFSTRHFFKNNKKKSKISG